MFINEDNFHVGNKAVAAVLLLYYHLLREGGFTNNQTVYLSELEFDGFTFINTQVSRGFNSDIDFLLINEGAAIYLLCELNDQIIDYEDDFLDQPYTQQIISFYNANSQYFISEFSDIVRLILERKNKLDYEAYKFLLTNIYCKYVTNRVAGLMSSKSLNKL